MIKTLAHNFRDTIARKPFIQRILQQDIDLHCLRRRPGRREIFGIFLVGLSYIIGWPAVAFFGFLSVYVKQPLVLIIGGPLIYGASHLMFIAGAYLAGKRYTATVVKWSCKKVCEKIFAGCGPMRADVLKAE